MSDQPTPSTEAGRRLVADTEAGTLDPLDYILAIEAQARARRNDIADADRERLQEHAYAKGRADFAREAAERVRALTGDDGLGLMSRTEVLAILEATDD